MMNLLKFKSHVYEPPFSPYYDKYKNQTFIADHFHPEDETEEHVWLVCVSDPSIAVDGYVHYHDLEYV
jgi:hypothetical protein